MTESKKKHDENKKTQAFKPSAQQQDQLFGNE
jgi:hypothetical protein